jgi:hypothetical protein
MFGYKATATSLTPKQYKAENVVKWFADEANLLQLSGDDIDALSEAIKLARKLRK